MTWKPTICLVCFCGLHPNATCSTRVASEPTYDRKCGCDTSVRALDQIEEDYFLLLRSLPRREHARLLRLYDAAFHKQTDTIQNTVESSTP